MDVGFWVWPFGGDTCLMPILRLLQRMPYSEKTDSASPFDYEEFATEDHNTLLWGPALIACASLLASAYAQHQWTVTTGEQLDIEDLPSVLRDRDGQRTLVPCAEANLSDRTAEVMSSRGVIPMLSYKNRNAARHHVVTCPSQERGLSLRWIPQSQSHN